MTRYDTISFLTDYGYADEFVGVCKGVIRQLAAHVQVIDLTHGVRAHDVRAGSLTLVRSIQYVPDGVVLAVVDPGVGSVRRAIAVEAGPLVLVGPDNGLLAPAVAMLGGARRAVSLTNAAHHLGSPGVTFAGRDIFAPAAAQLCNGVELDELGDPVDVVTLLPQVVPLVRTDDDGTVHAEVLWVDTFGNVQLNVGPEELDPFGERLVLRWGTMPTVTRAARRVTTYRDIGTGEIGLVVDSTGLVSLCLDRRSAAQDLGLGEGTAVTVLVGE